MRDATRATLARDGRYRRLLAAADAAAAAASVVLAIQLGDGLTPGLAAAAVPLAFVVLNKLNGLYDRDEARLRRTTMDEMPSLLHTALMVALLLWIADGHLVIGSLPPSSPLLLLGMLFGLSLVGRASVRRVLHGRTTQERCLVIGDATSASRLARSVEQSSLVNARVIGHVPLDASDASDLTQLAELVERQNVDRVLIAYDRSGSELMVDAARLMKGLGVKVSVLPRLFEIVGSSAKVDEVDGLLLLGIPRPGLRRSARAMKRALDITVSATALLALAPILLLAAAAIRLTSGGPVLERRLRRGPGGDPFALLSFRTAAAGGGPTRLGRLLRALSLGDAPKLLNVLKGQLSLVGPRPLASDEETVEVPAAEEPLRPGLTGPWRVQSDTSAPPDEAARLDYRYRAGWSLGLDLRILLRSLPRFGRMEAQAAAARFARMPTRSRVRALRPRGRRRGAVHQPAPQPIPARRRTTLSVIVPATNSPPTLDACLAAIERASDSPDEVLVVEDPGLKGPAAARNSGARQAHGEVLVFVDADVLVHEGAFARIREAFEHDGQLAALFGSYDQGSRSTGRVGSFRNLLHHHVHNSFPGQAATFWSGLGAVRREVFLDCGGFDADRFATPSVEDIDLGVRLKARGARIVLNPKVQGTHLKDWGIWEMVRTDFNRRGIPWVEILLRNRRAQSSALNLSWTNRLSAVATLVGVAALAVRRPRLAVGAAVGFLGLNGPFYLLLARRHGLGTSAAGIALHILHHLVGAAAVPAGLVAYVRDRRSAPAGSAGPEPLSVVVRQEVPGARVVGREEHRAETLAEV